MRAKRALYAARMLASPLALPFASRLVSPLALLLALAGGTRVAAHVRTELRAAIRADFGAAADVAVHAAVDAAVESAVEIAVDVAVDVATTDELRAALASACPGTTIAIAPGEYAGGVAFTGLRGTAQRPIVITAADPTRPPTFRGGACALQLSDAEHVELRALVIEGQSGNGLNIDDGGTFDTPSRALVLRELVVRDVGPRGNCDALKLSGVVGFAIESCTLERWGSGGSAIDLVGCSGGVIERCTLRNPREHATASGVQVKGGSHDVAIVCNRFEHAGERAVNIGGSTGLAYFRPPLTAAVRECAEARDVRVLGNTFVGSDAPIACVGVDGALVRWNTLYLPERWALRILQENTDPRFVASRDGVFSDNLVVFESATWRSGGVNVGAGTAPATFRFEHNAWTCADAPQRSRELVQLPAQETDGIHGIDPGFVDATRGDLALRAGSPLAAFGAGAFADEARR